MDFTDRTVRMCCSVGLMLMLPSVWAVFGLHCNVTQTSDGMFRLWLSEPPPAPDCNWLWEDSNKINLAVSVDNFSDQVFNVSDQYLILKTCSNYTTYQRGCLKLGWTAVVCSFNCSSIVTPPPPILVVPHIPGLWLWLTVAASILFVLCVFGSLVHWCRKRSLANKSHQDQTRRVEEEVMERMMQDQDQRLQADQMCDVKIPLAEIQPLDQCVDLEDGASV
ncbi:uncharacterized protein LOC115417677 [Sphaeramia orbicularis]|uniref:uncharacterized protein LOC115417677 n=1 Tax=Sphaeramia orbicularis TaxID=375764 RepID=UPI00117F6ADF|nr:uncharacterized protein LOC115417677 [Sphaeramia orbicularis]